MLKPALFICVKFMDFVALEVIYPDELYPYERLKEDS